MSAHEWQFDGLVGPTHNYAGLALGNMAAANNAGSVSNPRAAALQGLQKMKFVRDLGIKQAFVPPHFRPNVAELQRLGFRGDLGTILSIAAKEAPGVLASVFSSSFMWTANMATVTPSADAADGRLHLTPANLASHYHRGMESDFSLTLLKTIFHNTTYFSVHNYLPSSQKFGDEGAANHMRSNHNHDDKSWNLFVYGNDAKLNQNSPQKFPARQQQIASAAVARLHQLDLDKTLFLQQSPEAIDHGIFHNDVIAMNTTRLIIAHERSFIKENQELIRKMSQNIDSFRYREVLDPEFSISDAVDTYLFNSQLLELPSKKFALVAPSEVANHAGGTKLVQQFLEEGLIDEVHYLDVRESMRNGGGPACLRLRVVMTETEENAIHSGILLTDEKFTLLTEWVNTYYRDTLCFEDLADPAFTRELVLAYRALEGVIGMLGLYADGIRAVEAV